jgi:ferredoxin-NADP reductase
MLTVERIEEGEVSPYLIEELRVGDQVELRGLIGGYFVWSANDEKNEGLALFLVAGGSGIAPLMAMIRHRAYAVKKVPTKLLYSSRSFEDVIYREELDRLARNDSSLSVIHTLTRRQPQNWTGYRHRIDRTMLAENAFKPSEKPLVFACGSTGLIEAVSTYLLELGHKSERIKTERFGATGN